MTVKEMIERLKNYPEDAEVQVDGYDDLLPMEECPWELFPDNNLLVIQAWTYK